MNENEPSGFITSVNDPRRSRESHSVLNDWERAAPIHAGWGGFWSQRGRSIGDTFELNRSLSD